MRYYVTADVHGFFSELKSTLEEKGFFEDKEPHKLIVCGDLFDRGEEALQLQAFILDLMEKDQVILIRGNHEDLALQLLNGWHRGSHLQPQHRRNGTVGTVCQLAGVSEEQMHSRTEDVGRDFLRGPYIQEIIPAMVNYFETEHYIFVHGWIPCVRNSIERMGKEYIRMADWREASEVLWNEARWINGMEAAHKGITEPGKTIVCGHWHTSFGHCYYKNDGGEFGYRANFTPYYAEGIIALDACTVYSGKVNCIVIED